MLKQARCLLWSADVQDSGAGNALHWIQHFLDEDAALTFAPIERHPGESLPRAWNRAVLPEDRDAYERTRTSAIRAGSSYQQEFRYHHRDGTIYWLHEDVQVKTIEPGRRWYVVGVSTDITERKVFEQHLRAINESLVCSNIFLQSLAITDRLTGLHNHGAFQERLRDEVQRANRYQSPLSLMMLDVDYFKRYNDAFGHPAGDRILQQIARILQDIVRTTDFVARYGGEEFAVILPETDAHHAREAAERLRITIESTAWELRPVTASFGVATLSPTSVDAIELIQRADSALYRSKIRGRNRVTHSTPSGWQ